jgi:hypothetical protein
LAFRDAANFDLAPRLVLVLHPAPNLANKDGSGLGLPAASFTLEIEWHLPSLTVILQAFTLPKAGRNAAGVDELGCNWKTIMHKDMSAGEVNAIGSIQQYKL